MHRLRGRRKGNKEEEIAKDATNATTNNNNNTSGFAKTFKRNKSQPPPVTRQPVDLTAALPSQDDFRISLLMPNLEQRFSVLRDTESEAKPGPGLHGMGYGALASGALSNEEDQSGDFSKPPFGNAGLQDITETASITSSGREKSINSRKNSQSDDSFVGIMNRPRAGEGNVLFGGRQKVFRVNTAISKPSDDVEKSPSSPGGKGMGGRALFYDDLPASSYAAERRRERDRKQMEREERDTENPRSASPSLTYNNDRNTSSSLGSNSLARSSTAATSITSHSNLNYATSSGSTSKPRRLIYEQGLDRDLQEQNNSTQKLEVYAQRRMGNTPSPVPSSQSDDDRPRPLTPLLSESKLELSDDNTQERSISPKLPLDAQDTKPDLSTSTCSNVFGTFDFGIPLQSNSDELSVLNFSNDHGLPTPRTGSSEFQPATEDEFLTQRLKLGEPSPLPSPLPDDFDRIYRKAQAQAPQKSFLSQNSNQGPDTTSFLSPFPVSDRAEGRASYGSSHPADVSFLEGSSEADTASNYGDSYYSRNGSIEGSRIIHDEHYSHAYSQPGQAISPPSPSIYPQDDISDPLDSPTLPSHGGLSSMIRQHLRSDSGISSIYALSIHPNRTEVTDKQDAKSPTFNDWDNSSNCDNFLDREYQEDMEQPRGLLTLAELKRRDALIQKHREKTLSDMQMHMPGSEYERPQSNRSNDDWQNELAHRRMVVQQKLNKQSGRNSPNHSQSDHTEDQFANASGRNVMNKFILTPNGSQEDIKGMKILGITNQHGKPSSNRSQERLYISQNPSRDNLRHNPEAKWSLNHSDPEYASRTSNTLSSARPNISSRRSPPNLPVHGGQLQSSDRLVNGNLMYTSPKSSDEVLDDLRPPHDRPPPRKQRRPSPPQMSVPPQQGSNGTQPFNSSRNRSNDDFQALRNQPRKGSNANEHLEHLTKGQGGKISSETMNRKISQDVVTSSANLQSRFSLDDSPSASTFAGRLRSNSKVLGRVSVPKPDIFLLSPSQTQISASPSTAPNSPAYFNLPPSNPATSSIPHSSSPPGATQQNAQTLADMHNNASRPTPTYQNSSGSLRDNRKLRVKKSDISNPKLEHTTSQMPSSMLIEAGPDSKAPSPPVVPPRGRPGPGVQGIMDNFTSGNDHELSRLKKSVSEGYSLHSKGKKDMARVPILVDQIPGGMI